MPVAPHKKTKQEIQEWLFNDLMGRIEPDLIAENRPATVQMLNTLSPEELKEKLTSYEEAFKEFVRRWPAYVETVVADLEKETDKFKSKISQGESAEMAEIEKQLSSSDTDA